MEALKRTALRSETRLTVDQVQRYGRHLVLPQVGGSGQRKLLRSRVLLIGAGGLGSSAALYLAAAGVGRLGIVDDDTVEISNLQRQILHRTADIGRPKVESAARTLRALNPDVEVVRHPALATPDNVFELLDGYDVVLDGSDNFEAHYLLNDACVLAGSALVHGSILQFQGQVTTIDPGRGPCYRCLYPTQPPPELVPT